ncbi:MAG: Ig domain of plant-specific actin-binding protein, partial [Solirubrobacteraceae bacterium]|nr:Ig domain of plant-specific actin-binding protein [Solirubrobacteraceae bacterium]
VAWQRSVAGGDWQTIPGAASASYAPTGDDVGALLRVLVTATNSDGSAAATSMPTGAIADLPAAAPAPAPVPPRAVPATTSSTVRIVLRDGRRRAAGSLTIVVGDDGTTRVVRSASTRVALPRGSWRLRLCAAPGSSAARCGLGAPVRAAGSRVRLPTARVVIRGKGLLRLSATIEDRRLRVGARGRAAGV